MIKNFSQTMIIRGDEINITMPAEFNSEGELIYNQKLDDNAILKATEIYQNRHNMVTSKEIHKYLFEMNITKKELAKKAGVSKTAVRSICAGGLLHVSTDKKIQEVIRN